MNSSLIKDTIVYTYDTARIIKSYKNDFGLDVSRFFENVDGVNVHKNNRSKLMYVRPARVAGDDQFYQELESQYNSYYSKDKWEFRRALEYINSKDNVLEIGCGNGYFLEILSERGVKSEGIEMNSKAVKYCVDKGLSVSNKTIEELVEDSSNRYDVICAFQVFEHIPNVERVMLEVCKLLKRDGILIFGVPNNESLVFKLDKYHTLNTPPHHMVLWNEESIRGVCNEYLSLNVLDIVKQPADKFFRANLLRLLLNKVFGVGILNNLFYKILRPFVKVVPIKLSGNTIMGIYQK